MCQKTVLFILICNLCFISMAFGDLIFEYEISTSAEENTYIYHEKNYVSEIGLRIQEVESQTMTIVRGDKELIWNIDLSNNIYYEIPFDKVNELKDQSEEDVEFKVEDTGIEAEIGKYSCTKYKVYMDGELLSEMWVTLDEPFNEAYFERYKKLSTFSFSGFEELEKIVGFPVQVTNYFSTEEVDIQSKTSLLSAKEVELEESIFELPEGLIKIKVGDSFK